MNLEKVCKHFCGTRFRPKCAVGVDVDTVTPNPNGVGCGFRMPCVDVTGEHGLATLLELGLQGTCEKREWLSDAEMVAEEDAMEAAVARMERMGETIVQVKKDHTGEDWRGVIKCPECGGQLHLSHSKYNGHVHGKCETESCLAWME